MKKNNKSLKKKITYTITREFLGKMSVEECIKILIKKHL